MYLHERSNGDPVRLLILGLLYEFSEDAIAPLGGELVLHGLAAKVAGMHEHFEQLLPVTRRVL